KSPAIPSVEAILPLRLVVGDDGSRHAFLFFQFFGGLPREPFGFTLLDLVLGPLGLVPTDFAERLGAGRGWRRLGPGGCGLSGRFCRGPGGGLPLPSAGLLRRRRGFPCFLARRGLPRRLPGARGLPGGFLRRGLAGARASPAARRLLRRLFLLLCHRHPPLDRDSRRPDHTIGPVSNRGNERVVIEAGSAGLRIEIRPLARTGGGRARLAAAAAVVLGAALYGTAHLAQVWETGLRIGNYDLPLGILVSLTLAVAVATPLALVGLSALAFAEETIAVGADE